MNGQRKQRRTGGERFATVSMRRGAVGIAVALLLTFGSCAAIVAGRAGNEPEKASRSETVGGVSVTPPVSTTTPTPPPEGKDTSGGDLPDLVISGLTRDSVVVVNTGRGPSEAFAVRVSGTELPMPGLLPAASTSRSFDCRDGTITAVVDPSNVIAEADESNNQRTEGPIDCESVQGPLPDLVVTRLTATRVVVANRGDAASGGFSVNVGTSTFPFDGLRPGASSFATFACREGTLAATADALGAVDESDETNNARTAGPLDCPKPDLVVTRLTRDEVVVANHGDAPARSSKLHVSGNGNLSVPRLEPGADARATFDCTEGTLTAKADSSNAVAESNETNNLRTAGPFSCPKPDLVVASITNASVTVKNQGNADAGTFTVSITQVGDVSIPGLAAGATKTVDFSCREGSIQAVADADDRIEESDEGNNALTEKGLACPKPDLVITSLSATSVTVANTGDAGAGSFQVVVTGLQSPLQVGGLAAGASVTLDFTCLGGQFTATADAADNVIESNEGNNSASANNPNACIE